jgi:hypothetical protein
LGKKHISCIKNAATVRSLDTKLVPIQVESKRAELTLDMATITTCSL